MSDSEEHDVIMESDASEGGDEGENDEPEPDEDRAEYDPETGQIIAYRVDNEFVDAEHPFIVRQYSTVMVQAPPAEPYKFVGIVRKFTMGGERTVQVQIRWFYRHHDLTKQAASQLLLRPARLSGCKQIKGIADKGRLKEIYFSDHMDTVPAQTIMHPIKVWCLPDNSVDPITLPPLPAPPPAPPPAAQTCAPAAALASRGSGGGAAPAAAAPAAPSSSAQLLPGFVCRRLVLSQRNKAVMRLGEAHDPRKQLDAELVQDVAELLRRTREGLGEFAAAWRRRTGREEAAPAPAPARVPT